MNFGEAYRLMLVGTACSLESQPGYFWIIPMGEIMPISCSDHINPLNWPEFTEEMRFAGDWRKRSRSIGGES